MTRALNTEQERAVHVRTNAVVAAGAGSGKTTVLAERFVRLIAAGEARVDQVLTLTFTKKAAAEMVERIYRRLVALSGDSGPAAGLQSPAQSNCAAAAAAFESAQISTIDSFCAAIARDVAPRLGIVREFVMDEHRIQQLVLDLSGDFLVAHIEQPILSALVYQHGFAAVRDSLFVSLGIDYFTPSSVRDLQGDYARQLDYAVATLRSAIASVVSDIQRPLHELDGGNDLTTATQRALLATTVDFVDRLVEQIAGMDDQTVDAPWASVVIPPTKFAKMRGKSDSVSRFNSLEPAFSAAVADITAGVGLLSVQTADRAVLHLLEEFGAQVVREKRARGLLRFQDVAEMAVWALAADHEVRRFYHDRFRFVMIDEFQDNNALQKGLLYLLTARRDHVAGGATPTPDALEPDRLFFVGDEKQSIYQFRGADVSVFKALSAELGPQSRLSLATNYRSRNRLIRFFNAFFGQVFAGAHEAFEAEYSDLRIPENRDPDPLESAVQSSVTVHYQAHDDHTDADTAKYSETEAYYIAAYIHDVVENHRLLVARGEQAIPAGYDDIAVLFRAGGNQYLYERMFKKFGIPFHSDATRSLYLDAPVNDIVNLLQLLVYPDDSLAYAAVLRSPFVGIDDGAVGAVLATATRGATAASDTESDAAREPFAADPGIVAAFDSENQARYANGQQRYRRLQQLIDRVSTAELLRRIWFDEGYRYVLLSDPRYHDYLEYVDQLIAVADEVEQEPVVEFLFRVRDRLGSSSRFEELPVLPEEPGHGVTIETIHKSKGLQYPIVIVADLGRMVSAPTSKKLLHRSADYGVCLTLNAQAHPVVQRDTEASRRRDLAELKRLLYVACTRAESHLLLSGSHHRTNRSSEMCLLNTVLNALGWVPQLPDRVAAQFADLVRITPLAAVDKSMVAGERGRVRHGLMAVRQLYEQAPRIHRPPVVVRWAVTDADAPFAPAGSEPASLGVGVHQLPSIQSDAVIGAKNLESEFGTFVHRSIERVCTARRLPSAEEFAALVPGRLKRDLTDQQLRGVVADTETLVRRLFAETWLQQRLRFNAAGELPAENAATAGHWWYSELPFVAALGETPTVATGTVTGVIDLVVVDSQGIAVYDFKTDSVCDPAAHRKQLDWYRYAATRMFARAATPPGTAPTVRAYLVYVRSNEVVEV